MPTPLTKTSSFVALMLMFAATAGAQQPPRADRMPPPQYPVLTATGHGEVSVPPDRAVVRLGASAQEKDATAAQAKVNEIVQAAIEQIQALGVKKAAIKTARVSLSPVYSNEAPPRPLPRNAGEPRPPQPPHVVGYRADNVLEVRVDDLAQVGGVIDAGTGAGANNIEGISFELARDTQATQDALRNAAESAKAKAEAIASALGLKLDGIVEVSEGNVQRPVPMMGRAVMAMAQDRGGAPIEAGELKITAEVTVTYRVSDK